MKDEIPYRPSEKRIRPVSCPPTPRPRPKPETETVKSPRPKSTARVRIKAPEKVKPAPNPLPSRRPIDFPKIPRDISSPKPFKCEGNCPVPIRKMSISSQPKSPMPRSEPRVDYDLRDSGSGKKTKTQIYILFKLLVGREVICTESCHVRVGLRWKQQRRRGQWSESETECEADKE